MEQITSDVLETLALGSALLGSGGGGDPTHECRMAQKALILTGPVKLISVESLSDEALVLPFDFMGAPMSGSENQPSGLEMDAIFKRVKEVYGKTPDALMTGEIGGANAFPALIAASHFKLPLIDGDQMGRAFPKLQMCTPFLKGISATPAFLADRFGNSVVIHAFDGFAAEKIARQVAVAMGSICALSVFVMNGAQAKEATIRGSYSKAITLGKEFLASREEGKAGKIGKLLAQGTLIEVEQAIENGFLEGKAALQTSEGLIELLYQNEYLFAQLEGKTLAATPDIITLIDQETGTPITSESLQCGLKVDLITLPAPDIWTTLEGLKIVGPQVFLNHFNIECSTQDKDLSEKHDDYLYGEMG